MKLKSAALSVLGYLVTTASAYKVLFINSCPDPLALYDSENTVKPLAYLTGRYGEWHEEVTEGTVSWYTNLNRGKADGENALQFTARPADQELALESYFLSKPANGRLGVGIGDTALPGYTPSHGDCPRIECDSIDCPDAFNSKEDAFDVIKAPTSPLYTCSDQNHALNYVITFCPGGRYATELESRQIHPKDDQNKCLDVKVVYQAPRVKGRLFVNDCNESENQKWILDGGRTHIRNVGSSGGCIERETGGGVDVTQCSEDTTGPQDWYFEYGRIMFGDDCLDFADSGVAGDFTMKRCERSRMNQLFTV